MTINDTDQQKLNTVRVAFIAELLLCISSYHPGVVSTASTPTCHPAALQTDNNALTHTEC